MQHSPIDFDTTDYNVPPYDELAKKLLSVGHATFETGHKRRDGKIIPVEINYHIITLLGQKTGVAIVRDISERKQAEEALHRSEERYRAFFTTSMDCVFITTREGTWVDFNDAAISLFGYESREELHEVNIRDLYSDPSDRNAHIRYISERGYSLEYPVNLRKKDGTVINTLITSVARRDTDGNIIGFQGSIRDITESRKVEEALRNSEARLHTLVLTIPDLIWLKDADGIYLSCNTMFERFFGAKESDIVGKTDYDFVDHELADFFRENDRKAVAAGRPTSNEEWITFADDGHRALLDTIKTPMYDARGTLIGVLGIGRDITERKRGEEALRESEQRFHEIFNNVNDAIELHEVRSDGLPGNYLEVNDVSCRMLQYSREELLGHSPLDFTTDYYNRPLSDIGNEISTLGHSQFETEHRRKDGTLVPVEINAHVVNLRGKTMVLSVVRDITERKQAEEALRQVNKKLNLLSGITRHDINNQLQVLSGYLELSEESLDDVAKISEYLIKEEQAVNAIRRQIVFTKEYQDLGVKDPVWQNVEACIEKSRIVLPIRDIQVIAAVSGLVVYADPLFEKVFYNLIDNALRYGGLKMTLIRITSQEKGQELVIFVEDDGAGISADNRKHLFERGFGQHTGLGLFLSREILAITGITITETGEPGKGARFEILVPKGAYRFSGSA